MQDKTELESNFSWSSKC